MLLLLSYMYFLLLFIFLIISIFTFLVILIFNSHIIFISNSSLSSFSPPSSSSSLFSTPSSSSSSTLRYLHLNSNIIYIFSSSSSLSSPPHHLYFHLPRHLHLQLPHHLPLHLLIISIFNSLIIIFISLIIFSSPSSLCPISHKALDLKLRPRNIEYQDQLPRLWSWPVTQWPAQHDRNIAVSGTPYKTQVIAATFIFLFDNWTDASKRL